MLENIVPTPNRPVLSFISRGVNYQSINRFILVSLFENKRQVWWEKLYKSIQICSYIDIEWSDQFGQDFVKNKGCMKSKRKQKAKRMVSFDALMRFDDPI
jgi:hypothetical protein